MNWRACKAIAMAVLAMTFLYSLMSILSTSPTNALQIATVGYLPTDIAVDTYTNHVFVVNYGSGDTTPTPSVSILDARSGVVQATVNVVRAATPGRERRELTGCRRCMQRCHQPGALSSVSSGAWPGATVRSVSAHPSEHSRS